MMGRIAAVAVNTFREAVRDRVLYGLLGIASFVLLFSLVLAQVSLDQKLRIVLDVGLASISLFSVVASIFLGSSLLYKEIERKTLYVILPKPIHRHEFLLGKYAGIVLTASVFVAVQGAVQMLVTSIQARGDLLLIAGLALGSPLLLAALAYFARDRTAVALPWALVTLAGAAYVVSTTEVETVPILAALMLTVGEVIVLTAVALFFSSFSTPFLTALLTFGVWVAGRSADAMATMKSSAIPEVVRSVLKEIVIVWPNFHLFVPGRHTLETQLTQTAGPLSYVGSTLLYAVNYSLIVLAVAALVFRRRDFL